MNDSENIGRPGTPRPVDSQSLQPYGLSPTEMQNVERVLHRLLRSEDASEVVLVRRVKAAIDALNRGKLLGPTSDQSVGVDAITRLAARVIHRLGSGDRDHFVEQQQLA